MESRNRTAFWAGLAAVTAGVLLHLPMFIGASDMDYRLVGMGFDAPMIAGMALILAGLAAAVTIDVMKPVTLGFVVPGMAKEYDLKSPVNLGASVPVALLPLAGISGTVVGSFLWGELSDRVGRRASILFAG